MPRRNDISSILIIGSGPIVIGQACEFDYSGTQACRVLKDEGYRVILANSNPATIMTDPDFADATYIEPLTLDVLKEIIAKEKPDALLATLGGQTALNLATEAVEAGVLEQYGVELIGADAEAIATAEDRDRFKKAMLEIGLEVPRSGVAKTLTEAKEVLADIGLPVIIRPAYILGGRGTGMAETLEEFERVASAGIEASPISEILIEESIKGWKEFEVEVMRDDDDHCIVVATIENFDAMGVHTGDSITVAPAQTLSASEYEAMKEASFAILRRVGVRSGGSNVQFAMESKTGRQVVIEMNPRVSRSSALASKATGFPIAKISARLAVGYTLDEIVNDMTKVTKASTGPTIDYVVTKIPRWAFEKFPGTAPVLGTQMQSVGEVMSIGTTFAESLQKGLRSLETGNAGLNADRSELVIDAIDREQLLTQIATPSPGRIFEIASLLRRGVTVSQICEITGIDPWFIDQLYYLVQARTQIETLDVETLDAGQWRRIKQCGFSDTQLAYLFKIDEKEVRELRESKGVYPSYKTVDTCAGEFPTQIPYHYSTWTTESEVEPCDRPKVVILGSGPNRIGQGIEFDYCCVHASFALREAGYETIMVNCNPETVSTDYETSDRLYFEPLTFEDVQNIIDAENASGQNAGGPGVVGVVVGLGGQTPLKLATQLDRELIAGTSPDSIDLAEDRDRWSQLLTDLAIAQPAGGTATTAQGAKDVANSVGYPVLVRPSYVLGGRAMRIVYDDVSLESAMAELAQAGSLGKEGGLSAQRPVLIDRFLEDGFEFDVDAIRDRTGEVIIGGIMEHIEAAGIHSGDSACVIPPQSLPQVVIEELEKQTCALAEALDVVGLLNVQFAVTVENCSETGCEIQTGGPAAEGNGSAQTNEVLTDSDMCYRIYVIEANPRASRTVPFVAKATGEALVKIATRVKLGATLEELRAESTLSKNPRNSVRSGLNHVAVKEAVLPFNRFPDTDSVLGPEMRSTGEVMGIDLGVGRAFVKSQLAAGLNIPETGGVFISLADRDKTRGVELGATFAELGYRIVATEGTAQALSQHGVEVSEIASKLSDGDTSRNNALDLITEAEVSIVINTPQGSGAASDGVAIRRAAGQAGLALFTTVRAATALAKGLPEYRKHALRVRPIQHYSAQLDCGECC